MKFYRNLIDLKHGSLSLVQPTWLIPIVSPRNGLLTRPLTALLNPRIGWKDKSEHLRPKLIWL